jgi:hypothetical protein
VRSCRLWFRREDRQLNTLHPLVEETEPGTGPDDAGADSVRLSLVERPEQRQAIPRVFDRLAESELKPGFWNPDQRFH